MGVDKALLVTEGSTILARTAQAALVSGEPTVVIGRPQPSGWPLTGVKFLPDPTDGPLSENGAGPLGGLLAALRYVLAAPPEVAPDLDMREGSSGVLLLACDMPRLTPEAISWLLKAARDRNFKHGLVIRNAGRVEPLFSVYRPILIPLIEARMAANRFSMRGLLETSPIVYIDAPDEICAALTNVNSPEEWRQAGGRP
jgi:molybdenum cofactor guanylyltransferase